MIPYTRMGERSYRFLRLFGCDRLQAQTRRGHIQGVDEMRSIADEDGAYDIRLFGLPVPVR